MPSHLIYGININEKCRGYSDESEFTNDDARASLKHTSIALNKFFRRFENEYIENLQEKMILDNLKLFESDSTAYIGDVVLFKEENIPHMN